MEWQKKTPEKFLLQNFSGVSDVTSLTAYRLMILVLTVWPSFVVALTA